MVEAIPVCDFCGGVSGEVAQRVEVEAVDDEEDGVEEFGGCSGEGKCFQVGFEPEGVEGAGEQHPVFFDGQY